MSHENLIVSSTSDELAEVVAAADATNEMLAEGRPPEIVENISPETLEAAAENPEARAEDLQRSQQRPPKSKVQKRFDKLTARNYELEERLQRLEAELQGRTGQDEAARPTSERPKAESFATYDEFNEALSDWKAEQKGRAHAPQLPEPPHVPEHAKEPEFVPPTERERREAELAETRARESRDADQNMQAHLARVQEVRAKIPDFDQVVAAARGAQIPRAVADVLPTFHNSGAMVYLIAKNPEFAAELTYLAQRNPHLAVARIGQLSATLDAVDAQAAQQRSSAPVRVPVSHAPKPIKPVGSSPTRSSVPLDEADYQTFRAARQAQEKNRYRGLSR
jgi:hypothetical protein